MKKILICIMLISFFCLLTGCNSKTPIFYDEDILLDANDLIAEMNLSQDQIAYFNSNTVTAFLEFKDGYLIQYYPEVYSEVYLSYFENEETIWTLGPFRSLYDLTVLDNDVFTMFYGYELLSGKIGYFNSSGEEVFSVNSNFYRLHNTEDGGYITAETKYLGIREYYEDYYLVKVTENLEKETILELKNMVYVDITDLEDMSFLVETRDKNDEYTYFKVDQDGEIVYHVDLENKVGITPVREGLLVNDAINDQIYKVDDENNEIWRIDLDHYQINLWENNEDYLIIFYRNSESEGYMKIFGDGTYEYLVDYEIQHMSPVYREYDNGNRLGVIYTSDGGRLTYMDELDQIIWQSPVYDSVLSYIMDGDSCYLNVFIEEELYLVRISQDGEEIERYDISYKIDDITSDGGFLGFSSQWWELSGFKVIKYDENANKIWNSTKTYHEYYCSYFLDYECMDPIDYDTDFFEGILEARNGNYVVTYFNLEDKTGEYLGASYYENTFLDIYSPDGDLIVSYEDIYSCMEYIYSDNEYIFVHAINQEDERVLIKLGIEGNVVSERNIVYTQYPGNQFEYYFIENGRLYRLRV